MLETRDISYKLSGRYFRDPPSKYHVRPDDESRGYFLLRYTVVILLTYIHCSDVYSHFSSFSEFLESYDREVFDFYSVSKSRGSSKEVIFPETE